VISETHTRLGWLTLNQRLRTLGAAGNIPGRLCADCARKAERNKSNERRRRGRNRNGCSECKWRAVTPPRLGRKTLGVYNTRQEAEAKLQEALVNHRRGFELLPTDLTVRDVVERYFRDGTTDNLSITTLHRYRELWTIHGAPLGAHAIADPRAGTFLTLRAHQQIRGVLSYCGIDRCSARRTHRPEMGFGRSRRFPSSPLYGRARKASRQRPLAVAVGVLKKVRDQIRDQMGLTRVS
jgi:hypothetical protein